MLLWFVTACLDGLTRALSRSEIRIFIFLFLLSSSVRDSLLAAPKPLGKTPFIITFAMRVEEGSMTNLRCKLV